jgi:hypothetical protein
MSTLFQRRVRARIDYALARYFEVYDCPEGIIGHLTAAQRATLLTLFHEDLSYLPGADVTPSRSDPEKEPGEVISSPSPGSTFAETAAREPTFVHENTLGVKGGECNIRGWGQPPYD